MPHLPTSFHIPRIHIDGNRNLKLLYLIRFLMDFADRLASFFIPIFLFQLGNNQELVLLPQKSGFQNGLLLVSIYFLVFRLTALVTTVPISNLIAKLGSQINLFLGQLILGIVFAVLSMVPQYPVLVFVAAFLTGIRVNMFWISYHTSLSKFMMKKHVGEDLGFGQLLVQMTQMSAPALGGFLALTMGYSTLFLIALTLILIGAIAALFVESKPIKLNFKFFEMVRSLKSSPMRRTVLAFAGKYVNDAVMALWPLYVFLILGGVEKVGYLYSFSFFIAMIFTIAIGYYVDHTKSHKGFFTSGGMLSFIWLLRTGVFSIWSIALVDAADKLLSNFYWLFFDTLIYRAGKAGTPLSYFVMREFIISSVAVLFWSSLALIFVLVENSWTVLFVLAAVGVLFSMLLSDRAFLNHEKNTA